MTESDLAAADELRQLAGWNQTQEDWRQLLAFEPDGCFVALGEGRVIGTVTTTTYGRELAWIGMMLVHPEHRRRGIGTRLMQAALEFVQHLGIACIRLDATPAGHPVYQRLGFVSEWTLTRHQARGLEPQRVTARELAETDWPAVDKLDTQAFGVDRGRILRGLAKSSRLAVVWPATGPIAGYGMLRSGSQCDYLGPVVCAARDGSETLISALLRHGRERAVFWDVPDENAHATALARIFGFGPIRALARMRLGPNSAPTSPDAQLAIADPSLG